MSSVFLAPFAPNRPHPASVTGKSLTVKSLTVLAVAAALTAISVPAFAQGRAKALESLRVPGDGRAVSFKISLDSGELFLLKAVGSVKVGGDTIDAEYGGFNAGTPGQDVVRGTDVGVDVGITSRNVPAGAMPERRHWFGSYRPDHTYDMIVSGTGHPLTLHLLSNGGRTQGGGITVSVFRLSPAPPALPEPLESLSVPVLDRIVPTAMTTRPTDVYLLQASGSGRVGGGGLGQGDAEFMDYNADGTGQVDVGDFHTDYGLGVDEADQSVSPRLHKWGLWRKDHTYYMLFAGTGRPIHFFFYDVKGGYGDNSKTDTLTVKIFPAP